MLMRSTVKERKSKWGEQGTFEARSAHPQVVGQCPTLVYLFFPAVYERQVWTKFIAIIENNYIAIGRDGMRNGA